MYGWNLTWILFECTINDFRNATFAMLALFLGYAQHHYRYVVAIKSIWWNSGILHWLYHEIIQHLQWNGGDDKISDQNRCLDNTNQ